MSLDRLVRLTGEIFRQRGSEKLYWVGHCHHCGDMTEHAPHTTGYYQGNRVYCLGKAEGKKVFTVATVIPGKLTVAIVEYYDSANPPLPFVSSGEGI